MLKNNITQITESYNNFDWRSIEHYIMLLVNKDFSHMSSDDLYDYLLNYFDEIDIELRQTPDYFTGPWKDDYVFNGQTTNDGYVTIYIDFENVYNALIGQAYKRECVASLAATAVHELMHRYQCIQYPDRKWDRIKSEEDYYANKDEISAHIIGGLTELLSLGYTEQDLLEAVKHIDSELNQNRGPFWESDSLYVYWREFGSYDTSDPVWLRFKKELAQRIYELNEDNL